MEDIKTLTILVLLFILGYLIGVKVQKDRQHKIERDKRFKANQALPTGILKNNKS